MRLLPVLLVGALLLGACSGDDDTAGGDVADPSSTATSGDTTTTTATVLPTALCAANDPSTATWVDGPVRLDADGDGLDDEAELFVVDGADLELQVTYGAGGRTLARFQESVDPAAAVRIERVADIEGDGDDDLWLVVAAGASTEVVSLVVADGCDLVRPFADEGRNVFPVGASVGFLSGVECTDIDGNGFLDGFVVHAGGRTTDSIYEGTSEWWVPDLDADPPRLHKLQTEAFTVDLDAEDGSQYASLSCA